MGNGNTKLQSGLNLVKEAQKHYEVIQEFNFTPQIFHEHAVLRAIERYEKYWLPLVAQYPKENLIPPLDIELIWVVHMHNPVAYKNDCFTNVGCFVDHTIATIEERHNNKKTKELWEKKYPNVSFKPVGNEKPRNFASKLSSNLANAVIDYRLFCRQVSLPHYRDEKFLFNAVRSYIYHAQYDDFAKIAYPYDKAFIWKTHMLRPIDYRNDVNFLKEFLNETSQNTLPREERDSNIPGAMFRGDVAPLLPATTTDDLPITVGKDCVLNLTTFRLENLEAQRNYHLKLYSKVQQNNHDNLLLDVAILSKGKILLKSFLENTQANTFNFDTTKNSVIGIRVVETNEPQNSAPITYDGAIKFPVHIRIKETIVQPFSVSNPHNKIAISGWMKLHCSSQRPEAVNLTFIKNNNCVVRYQHYGKVLNQPLVMAPYVMKLDDAPCTYLNLVVVSMNNVAALKCRVLFSDLGDFSSVELFDLKDNVIASSHTIGKEALPTANQIADGHKCCVFKNNMETIYIVRGTNTDCGILRIARDDDSKPVSVQFLNMSAPNSMWETIFNVREGSARIVCKSKQITVDLDNAVVEIKCPDDFSGALSLSAVLIATFCSGSFQ